jgi:hypothetical protein
MIETTPLEIAEALAHLGRYYAASDLPIAKRGSPGSLKDDGKRGGAEKGFRH